LFLISCLTSCAFFNKKDNKFNSKIYKRTSKQYELVDKSGRFLVERDTGYVKSKNSYIVKKRVLSFGNTKGKVLEKSITISNPGFIGKSKLHVLRPKVSQYTVWFDGKKYSSKMSIDLKDRAMVVELKSPEEQWRGTKRYDFPKGTGVYCFYSQLIECASVTGFMQKALKSDAGIMKFHIIWDGFPYFQEQYLNVSNTVFEEATLKYGGKNNKGLIKFTLDTKSQIMFFFVDSDFNLKKQLWVSQGYSMVESE
jgi:hypothetical protein